jgi:hypothetical protein
VYCSDCFISGEERGGGLSGAAVAGFPLQQFTHTLHH